MAKTLEYADTSAQTVKIGDTTTSFTMVLGEDSNPVDLTNATSIIAKLGNNSGYLKSQTIPTSSITDPLSGKIVISFDSDFMSGLPAGSYLLEVWVTYSTGVSIYPSNTMTGFTINNNIEDSGGSTITTITFDDFVKELNKAVSTIDKGGKGDDGLSAYQVAVSNGYHGSQTDWLASLVGPKGNKGDDAVVNVVTQAQYSALADKSGLYVIQG